MTGVIGPSTVVRSTALSVVVSCALESEPTVRRPPTTATPSTPARQQSRTLDATDGTTRPGSLRAAGPSRPRMLGMSALLKGVDDCRPDFPALRAPPYPWGSEPAPRCNVVGTVRPTAP